MPIPIQVRRNWPRHLLGIVLAGLAVLLLDRPLGLFQAPEQWSRDARHFLYPSTSDRPADVAVLYATEATLDRLECRVPIDRAYLAQRLAPLQAAGARALGLDLLFDHPGRGEARLKATLDGMPFPVFYAWIGPEHGLRPNQSARLEAFLGERQRGLATFLVDRRDGIARNLPAAHGATRLPPLAVALSAAAGGAAPTLPHPLAYSPRRPDGAPWIASYPLEFIDRVLADDPDAFRDKVLLVGVQSPLRDLHRAPFARFGGQAAGLPGVMLHAHAVAQLLQGRTLVTAPLAVELPLVLLFAGIGWLLALLDLRLAVQGALALALALFYASVSVATYAASAIFLPLTTPVAALLLGLLSGALVTGRQLRRQRARVRRVFAQYVPAPVVDRLVDTPAEALFAGQRQEITCLFTDIAGFTRLAERMDPVRLVEMMNRYFDGLTRILHRHGGTVDKFIGDAVLAFFGAPLGQADHADRAVAAAIDIEAFSRELSGELAAAGVPLGATRIGVHTGDAVIGNIGGELRQNYTALGDAVNLASRLEGANRHLGTRVCLSEATARQATTHPCRPIAEVVVKGRTQAVAVFEPLAVRADDPALASRYAAAYQLLARGDDPVAAHQALRELHAAAPDDTVVAMHLQRLDAGHGGATLILDSK